MMYALILYLNLVVDNYKDKLNHSLASKMQYLFYHSIWRILAGNKYDIEIWRATANRKSRSFTPKSQT